MPLISAYYIRHPRTRRLCDSCTLPIDGLTVRLYGMADGSNKPYAVYLHSGCVHNHHEKVRLDAWVLDQHLDSQIKLYYDWAHRRQTPA